MANFNFNKVILGGRLTADPELKHTAAGIPVTSFTVAVNRRTKTNDQRAADFITCVAWRTTAEFITKYFRKGSSICVVGNIQTRTWEDAQGNKRYNTEVVVEEVNFVDSASESQSRAPSQPGTYNPYTGAGSYAPEPPQPYSSAADDGLKFEELSNDDDLPF